MLASFCAVAATFPLASIAAQTDLTDDQVLALGYPNWIKRVQRQSGNDLDQLSAAERKFSMAMVRENEKMIAESPQGEALKNVQILFANITKGACRLADYQHYDTPRGTLLNRKSETLAVLTLNRYIKGEPNRETIVQSEIWDAFRKAEETHKNNAGQIRAFGERHGGYPIERYPIEFQGLGSLMTLTLKAVSKSTPDQKRHVFTLGKRLIELTTGQDPLPYTTAEQHPMAK